jgi:hypothetical protein
MEVCGDFLESIGPGGGGIGGGGPDGDNGTPPGGGSVPEGCFQGGPPGGSIPEGGTRGEGFDPTDQLITQLELDEDDPAVIAAVDARLHRVGDRRRRSGVCADR